MRRPLWLLGGRPGLNRRPLEPQSSALTKLSYIHRLGGQIYKFFYSENPLKEIIPRASEERAGGTALSHSYPRSAEGSAS